MLAEKYGITLDAIKVAHFKSIKRESLQKEIDTQKLKIKEWKEALKSL